MINEVSLGVEPFLVETDGIGMGEKWSKTLYIRIKPHELLLELNQKLKEKLGHFLQEDQSYSPHISLMYKLGMSIDERREIADQLDIPRRIGIRGIGIVDPGWMIQNGKITASGVYLIQRNLVIQLHLR